MSRPETSLEAAATLRWDAYAALCRQENGDAGLRENAPFQKRKAKARNAFVRAFGKFCNG